MAKLWNFSYSLDMPTWIISFATCITVSIVLSLLSRADRNEAKYTCHTGSCQMVCSKAFVVGFRLTTAL